ncbi:PocR ligand-binding domain-containing protein [Anaerotalea alkaliphila]|uniref:Helix-turn-helix domain-containing protein n=1 Tax=Anaerotalea alkaliphila TaxID=2662126 RepID=A0A7X5KLS7_9FIRM|nr:PocR ligand-binding domain-containing protein [Anaerotalea alkaliphila]NDL67009.1 helix-turn-helix domain-containing protein [Anaerotalea alkaliphila]
MDKFNIQKLLDLEKWQHIQDSLSQVTRLALITVDYKGVPVTRHSGCSTFCDTVRKDPVLAAHCRKCDSRGGLEAVRTGSPYIYLCHYGIVDVAVPITVDDNYIGAVMAGQVLLAEEDGPPHLERILSPSPLQEELVPVRSSLPVLPYGEIQSIAKMLFQLSNYIVEEAIVKNQLLHPETSLGSAQGQSRKNYRRWKEDMAAAHTSALLQEDPDALKALVHPLLKPAIKEIHTHRDRNIPLTDLAALCKVSPGYFSRLFSKELGESYSDYISNLKIKWATKLLLETDLSVTEISEALGFGECGYFIKKFKKSEGVTPLVYRKYFRNA